MGNFAVSASDELIARGKDLIEKLTQPGEKQSDALARMFNIVEEQADGEVMRQSGIDVQALDSSLANIRNMFLATVTGKEQIITEKDGKIAEIKELKDKLEKDLRDKLDAADAEKKAAAEQAEAAAKAAAQAIKDAQAAKEQAETAASLASEKDKTIATLAEKLSAAEAKAAGYDDLMQKETLAQEQIKDLHRAIEANQAEADRKTEALKSEYDRRIADADRDHADELRAAARELQAAKDTFERTLSDKDKDHDAEIRELRAKTDKQISDAEKDAALAAATAAAEKERECMDRIRAVDKENARLLARIEFLEERIKSLEAAASK